MKHFLLFSLFAILSIPALAQSTCDSIHVVEVKFDPLFSDVQISVILDNASGENFNYPGLMLLNSNNDTLAREVTNFFILPWGQQRHSLVIETPISSSDISNGTLLLYSDFYDTLRCDYVNDFELCIDSCTEINLSVQINPSNLETHYVSYVIEDQNATPVANGNFVVDTSNVFVFETNCLPSGNYTVTLSNDSNTNSSDIYFRVYSPLGEALPLQAYSQEQSLAFEVSPNCVDTSTVNAIEEREQASGLVFMPSASSLRILQQNGNMISRVMMHDLQGRLILDQRSNSSEVNFELANESFAPFIVTVMSAGEVHHKKVMLGL